YVCLSSASTKGGWGIGAEFIARSTGIYIAQDVLFGACGAGDCAGSDQWLWSGSCFMSSWVAVDRACDGAGVCTRKCTTGGGAGMDLCGRPVGVGHSARRGCGY